MKKPSIIIFVLICAALAFSGCASTQGQKIQNRVDGYADSMYLVFWGSGYEEASLPENIALSRNEFKEEFCGRARKFVFVTDGHTATALDEATVARFIDAMEEGFTLYFYSYQKSEVDYFMQKFRLKEALSSGRNFLLALKSDNGQITAALSFSNFNAEPFSKSEILLALLERNTH